MHHKQFLSFSSKNILSCSRARAYCADCIFRRLKGDPVSSRLHIQTLINVWCAPPPS